MAIDPFIGGVTVELDPTKMTNRDLSALSSGGIRDRHKPETTITHKYAAQPGLSPQQRAQAPGVNRNMVIVGYKGKADAWVRCLKEVLHVNGAQVDRAFYLGLDPREADRQAELMEVGSQAFSTFVVIPYRDALADPNPVGLPAARNLHSLVGVVTETYRNVGPTLIVLPFHTLMPGGFDIIERHYTHAIGSKGISFLGYEIKKSEGRTPGAAIVLPPLWARHPDFPLAKGLNPYTAGDISYIKDEILRAMRNSDVMIGDQMKPGAMTVLQTFPADQIMDLPKGPAFNPQGRPQPPTVVVAKAPTGEVTINNAPVQPVASSAPFSDEEKASALALISATGIAAFKILDAARYGVTLASDPEFAEQAQNKAQGWKIRSGKAAKAKG